MENKDLINLALKDVNGAWNKSFITTANCYVIKRCGRYCLPLVYGNALVNGEANPKAYTRKGKEENTQPFYDAYNKEITQPWIEGCVSGEVVGNDSPEDYVIDNIKVMEDGRYMEFEVTKFPELGGNAILAVKDKEGNVLWSWHLWAYADEIVDINGFMNVNLGWKWYDSEKKSGYNPHYQWGRKDPMLENCNICNAATNSFGEAIQKPGTFFCYESGNYNWVTVDGKSVNYYNYWNADCDGEDLMDLEVVKTVYDPCPVGFSIPKGDAFKGFNEDDGGEWEGGFTWNRRYFPAAGSRGRTSGSIYYVGSGGYYWSSAAFSRTGVYDLGFNSTSVGPRGTNGRAYGFSVVPVLGPRLSPEYTDLSTRSLNGDSRPLRENDNVIREDKDIAITEDIFVKNGWYVAKTANGIFYQATLNYPCYRTKPFWQININKDNMMSVYSSCYNGDNDHLEKLAYKKVETMADIKNVLRFCELNEIANSIVS